MHVSNLGHNAIPYHQLPPLPPPMVAIPYMEDCSRFTSFASTLNQTLSMSGDLTQPTLLLQDLIANLRLATQSNVYLVQGLAAEAIGGPRSLNWKLRVDTPIFYTESERQQYQQFVTEFFSKYLSSRLRRWNVQGTALWPIPQGWHMTLGDRGSVDFLDPRVETGAVTILDAWKIRVGFDGEPSFGSCHGVDNADGWADARDLVRQRKFLGNERPHLLFPLLEALNNGAHVWKLDWQAAAAQFAETDLNSLQIDWMAFQIGRHIDTRSQWVDLLNLLSIVQDHGPNCIKVADLWLRLSQQSGEGRAFADCIKQHPNLTPAILSCIQGAAVNAWLLPRDSQSPNHAWLFGFVRGLEARPFVSFDFEREPRHLAVASPHQAGDPAAVVRRLCQSFDELVKSPCVLHGINDVLSALNLRALQPETVAETVNALLQQLPQERMQSIMVHYPSVNHDFSYLQSWVARQQPLHERVQRIVPKATVRIEEIKVPAAEVPVARKDVKTLLPTPIGTAIPNVRVLPAAAPAAPAAPSNPALIKVEPTVQADQPVQPHKTKRRRRRAKVKAAHEEVAQLAAVSRVASQSLSAAPVPESKRVSEGKIASADHVKPVVIARPPKKVVQLKVKPKVDVPKVPTALPKPDPNKAIDEWCALSQNPEGKAFAELATSMCQRWDAIKQSATALNRFDGALDAFLSVLYQSEDEAHLMDALKMSVKHKDLSDVMLIGAFRSIAKRATQPWSQELTRTIKSACKTLAAHPIPAQMLSELSDCFKNLGDKTHRIAPIFLHAKSPAFNHLPDADRRTLITSLTLSAMESETARSAAHFPAVLAESKNEGKEDAHSESNLETRGVQDTTLFNEFIEPCLASVYVRGVKNYAEWAKLMLSETELEQYRKDAFAYVHKVTLPGVVGDNYDHPKILRHYVALLTWLSFYHTLSAEQSGRLVELFLKQMAKVKPTNVLISAMTRLSMCIDVLKIPVERWTECRGLLLCIEAACFAISKPEQVFGWMQTLLQKLHFDDGNEVRRGSAALSDYFVNIFHQVVCSPMAGVYQTRPLSNYFENQWRPFNQKCVDEGHVLMAKDNLHVLCLAMLYFPVFFSSLCENPEAIPDLPVCQSLTAQEKANTLVMAQAIAKNLHTADQRKAMSNVKGLLKALAPLIMQFINFHNQLSEYLTLRLLEDSSNVALAKAIQAVRTAVQQEKDCAERTWHHYLDKDTVKKLMKPVKAPAKGKPKRTVIIQVPLSAKDTDRDHDGKG